ncbi:GNAT family N-acetyltransferase [Weissella viridescens]|uniref:GNAT family N-acetyltransferase n=1 Tax=Weissella viridescens TaxID=1629 RepID=UPI001D07CF1A|nr:GNAT family N-acetyltransferase [Weissella viridescens]MCB6840012.1 GNAT family N-acetyltransferase [Weissella viridescens]MCB6846754.1 GNAT family N-acetyltransferase [Weissella viridescens]
MWITTKTKLTAHEKKQVQTLIHQVHQVDRTFKAPYLSNQYNYFPGMPTFILVYDSATQLAGFTMIYADEAPQDGIVDLIVTVLPAQRHQGIGRMMFNRAQSILDAFGYNQINYITERVFLDANPNLLQKLNMRVADSEYQMVMGQLVEPSTKLAATVRLMKAADIMPLVPIFSSAFDDISDEAAERYLTESLQDASIASYVLTVENTPIGYCAIDLSDYAYIFSVFIDDRYRSQGYGQYLLTYAISHLQTQGWKRIVLGVEGTNVAAKRLYNRIGFQDETEIVSLQQK